MSGGQTASREHAGEVTPHGAKYIIFLKTEFAQLVVSVIVCMSALKVIIMLIIIDMQMSSGWMLVQVQRTHYTASNQYGFVRSYPHFEADYG